MDCILSIAHCVLPITQCAIRNELNFIYLLNLFNYEADVLLYTETVYIYVVS